jgi:hypothetical protein
MKLTDWFPEDVTPVHPGVYETKFVGLEGFSEWNGLYWSSQYCTADRARGMCIRQGAQDKRWRGLAEKPE